VLAGAAALFAGAAAAQQHPTDEHTDLPQRTTAQQPSWQQIGPQYDRGSEMTVSGTVQSIKQQGSDKMGKGTHAMVRADDGRIMDVYLGPKDYLQQQNLKLRSGDKVTLTGARTSVNGRSMVVAREITKDNQLVTLRTAEGMPAWEPQAARTGQPQAERMAGEEVYDRAAETTIRGTVEDVTTFSRPGMEARQHAVVRTDDGKRITVQLGPPDWMSQQKYNIKRGDQIEVTGARVKFGADDSILAREVRVGNRSFTLRNAEGQPQWPQAGGAGRAERELYPQVQDPARAGRLESGMVYDPKREATIQGTIEEVAVYDSATTPGSTHVTIRTQDGASVVALMGPAEYLQQHNVTLRAGEPVKLTGSRMTFEGQDTVIARQIQAGGHSLAVRDRKGQPQWQQHQKP
jgi:DNA/RNA endonuclease YhcR with UshA esterase domain